MGNPIGVLGIVIAAVVVLIVVPILILFIRLLPGEITGWGGYFYKKTIQTEDPGLSTQKVTVIDEYQQRKTFWDWQQLLIVPIILALAAYGFNYLQNVHSEQLATDQQQQTTLETYIDRMSDLLLSTTIISKLHEAKKSDEIRKVAQGRTLIALERLDGKRKGSIVLFLYHADLITWHNLTTTPITNSDAFPLVSLATADLSGAELSGDFLANIDLHNTVMSNADLSGSILSYDNLSISDMHSANLSGAFLHGVDMRGTGLQNANLSGAFLNCNPRGASSEAVDINNLLLCPDLSGTYMNGANLSGADLRGVDMSNAHLPNANLSNAQLNCISLKGVSHCTNLQGADLSGANLQGADLSGANLKGAIVTCAQIAEAKSFVGATMPDGSQHC